MCPENVRIQEREGPGNRELVPASLSSQSRMIPGLGALEEVQAQVSGQGDNASKRAAWTFIVVLPIDSVSQYVSCMEDAFFQDKCSEKLH